MKYKLLKETPWAAEGAIIEFKQYRDGKDYSSETYDWMSWHIKNHPEYFEEVKETLEPRWKVGDCVAIDDGDGDINYTKINQILIYHVDGIKMYYINDQYNEEDLREPTPNELSLYFK